MFRFFVLLTVLLTFVVFSNLEAHDQSCYYLHLDGNVSVSNPLGQRLLTGSALVNQIRANPGPLGLSDTPFSVSSSAITITGGDHNGTVFEITGGLIQIDKDQPNVFGLNFADSKVGSTIHVGNKQHAHILYKEWTELEFGSVTTQNIGYFSDDESHGLDQPVQCSNEGTYAIWKEKNPDYDPDASPTSENMEYLDPPLNEEFLPGGSKNPNPQDQPAHIQREAINEGEVADSQERSSDEQGSSVNTQQQKSVSPPPQSVNTQQQKSVSPPPESEDIQQTEDESPPPESEDIQQTEPESPPPQSVNTQQQKSNDSADGEGDSGDTQQQKSNGDSETSEQPSDDPSEEMPRSNAGNAPAAFARPPGIVAWQVVMYDANGTVIRRVVGGVGQQSMVVYEGQRAVMLKPPPVKTELLANYPNPFNPETWIPYHLAKASDVQITIYDARGAVVRQLDLGHQREGYYINRSRAAHWDGRNAIGERVASGLYFYQLQADNMSLLRKMVILK